MFRDCYQIHISIIKINFILNNPDPFLWSDWTTNFWTAGCTSTQLKKNRLKTRVLNWLGWSQSKQKRTTLNKRWMESGNGWREPVTNGWTACGIGVQDTESLKGTLNELRSEVAEPQGMTALSGFMITGNYQTNLTCVEHWLPLFAAK